ncbi:probable Dol-P-Man:Man(7)GlcNAc(2)-PP-Dol alpha-1,6-mannosyltransferase isoform X2 [Cryptotermes secundus]|uniref:probable Dol-P-Man:Man(7)GlcNAc(2)-PP-Dol alpha-1,6-mannosyltransferase isoform X2 n=1 Tax=Cryptotermes secundus TaxID=105785 RepID=UPI000CD7B916|nr:probable Dol-P-Man:Man(7)GlcNAc(2)-PP-Dol alpha-1,6-mannosyltransferase isoform X2 [Cryptotermes secundus]
MGYDHHEFPGVVPRTFLGPLVISLLASPIVAVINVLGFSKFYAQFVVRAVLGLCVIGAFRMFRQTIQLVFGQQMTNWFVAITVTQYHFMYYLSRPLPNILALPLVLLALQSWIKQQHAKFIYFSAAAIIIFRAELAMFLGILLLIELVNKRIHPLKMLKLAIPAGLVFLSLTVVVDSIFWNRLLWPEGEVLFFNTVLNRSHEWGTSPFLWYFYSAIPRGMGCSVFLVPLGIYYEPRVRKILLPAIAFVFLFSFLPHKELRFIIYVFPLLNLTAASACHRIFENRGKSSFHSFLAFGVCCHLVLNAVFSVFLLCIAGANYPGGVAISRLHRLAKDESFVFVHIDVLAAQTGVSRFTQDNPTWRYSKAENITSGSKEIMVFTHLLLEARSKYSQNLKPYSRTHDILDSVEGFSHIAFNYNTFPPIRIKTKPMIFILKRKEVKLKYIENELSTDTEEVPFDIDILKTDLGQVLTSETENVLEVGGIDETLELGDEISQLLNDMDDDIFVRPVIHDNEDEHMESPLIDLNIEPTEDIEEEVQLSKLMRMSREELIKELNRAQNKAKIYPKSGTVKSNIKKIIREYKALEYGKQVKAEGSMYADLPPDEKVKHDEYVKVHEAEFSTTSEENYSDIHAKSEQVTKKQVLEKYTETDIQQKTDPVAVPVEMEAKISSLPPENLTSEEHHDIVSENSKKAIKKIKKYKVLDQSTDEESSTVIDNITVQRKKPIQKIRLAKQIIQKDVLRQETEYLEETREPKIMSMSTENQTVENENIEKKGGKKTNKDINEIILEFNNDLTNPNENLKDSESGTTENQPHLQISKTKKSGKKVLKEVDEEYNDTEISTGEFTAHVPDEETAMSKIRRKTVVRNLKKEKLIKVSDHIYHTPLSSNHASNEDQTDKLNAADAHRQENDMRTSDSKDTVAEYEVQHTSAQETTAVNNEIEWQEGEKMSDEISPKISTKYSAQPPKMSVKEINKLTKQIMKNAVQPDELPFEDLTEPERLPSTDESIMADDEITPISESREDIKLSKALTKDTETIQDEHRTENDETVEYEDIAKRKLDEVIPV